MPNNRPPMPPPLAGYRPANERPPAPGVRRGPPPPPMQGHGHGSGQGPRRGAAPKRRRSGLLSAVLYALFFLVLVVGGGAAYLVLNPPSDLIRQTLAEQVKEKTGRDLIVAGDAAFSFYPGLGVTLKNVSLSGPPGTKAMLVKMAELDVNIKTMPLLNRQVEVRRLILRQPVFDLRVDKQGRKNWTFGQEDRKAARGDGVQYAQAAAPAAAGDAAPVATDAPPAAVPSARGPGIRLPQQLSDIEHVALDDVRLENGTLRYTDERSGKSQQVSAVNMQVNLKSLSSALAAKGDFSWQGEKTSFDGKVSPVRMVLEEKPARFDFTASNRHLNASYDGVLHVHDGADLEGKITAKTASVKALAKWLGTQMPDVAGFGPLTLAGDLKTDGNVTSLTNASLGLDGATATGSTVVTTGGARPHVRANLQLSELDLNKYMNNGTAPAKAAAPQPATPAPKPAAKPAAGAKGTEPGSIEELLSEPASGPKVHGYTERDGWSSSPFNLSLFGLADTDAKLRVGRLLFQDIKVGQSALTVVLKNKVMKTTFDNVQLYDGRGAGFLNLDATNPKRANLGANFTLEGLQALPFLKDAADMDWLAGKARLALQIASQGDNQLQIVEGLNGKADFSFADGAIVGFNLPGAIRNASQGKFTSLKKAPTEKTDFSELAASFAISNGVAQNQDLRMTSPLLRVGGAGTVQLPQRLLDYTVKPKVVASLEGQQGAMDLSGLEIPVRISGPWAKPKIEPDLKNIDANKVVDKVKEIGKQLKGKNAKQIVNDLLGKAGAGDATGSTGSTSTKAKAKELLNKYLKQQ